jgi:hypothetical protein
MVEQIPHSHWTILALLVPRYRNATSLQKSSAKLTGQHGRLPATLSMSVLAV